MERESLTSLIRAYGLNEKVFLVGNMTDAARFLKAFDLLAFPSKSESYGYVAHEAGLAEVPIVATNVGGLPEIIEHNISGLLVPPDDALALTEALETLLKSKELRLSFVYEHKKRMLERSVEKMTKSTENLYLM